jgi:uncharacterized protein YecT (DUF1311 family)
MREIVFLLSLIIMAPMPAVADSVEDCYSPASSHAGQRQCLERLAETSEAELLAVETAISRRIAEWDEEQAFRDASRKGLEEAALEFRRYRTVQCEFEASVSAGGNGRGDMRLECEIRLNQTRVSELEKLTNAFERPHT